MKKPVKIIEKEIVMENVNETVVPAAEELDVVEETTAYDVMLLQGGVY